MRKSKLSGFMLNEHVEKKIEVIAIALFKGNKSKAIRNIINNYFENNKKQIRKAFSDRKKFLLEE